MTSNYDFLIAEEAAETENARNSPGYNYHAELTTDNSDLAKLLYPDRFTSLKNRPKVEDYMFVPLQDTSFISGEWITNDVMKAFNLYAHSTLPLVNFFYRPNRTVLVGPADIGNLYQILNGAYFDNLKARVSFSDLEIAISQINHLDGFQVKDFTIAKKVIYRDYSIDPMIQNNYIGVGFKAITHVDIKKSYECPHPVCFTLKSRSTDLISHYKSKHFVPDHFVGTGGAKMYMKYQHPESFNADGKPKLAFGQQLFFRSGDGKTSLIKTTVAEEILESINSGGVVESEPALTASAYDSDQVLNGNIAVNSKDFILSSVKYKEQLRLIVKHQMFLEINNIQDGFKIWNAIYCIFGSKYAELSQFLLQNKEVITPDVIMKPDLCYTTVHQYLRFSTNLVFISLVMSNADDINFLANADELHLFSEENKHEFKNIIKMSSQERQNLHFMFLEIKRLCREEEFSELPKNWLKTYIHPPNDTQSTLIYNKLVKSMETINQKASRFYELSETVTKNNLRSQVEFTTQQIQQQYQGAPPIINEIGENLVVDDDDDDGDGYDDLADFNSATLNNTQRVSINVSAPVAQAATIDLNEPEHRSEKILSNKSFIMVGLLFAFLSGKKKQGIKSVKTRTSMMAALVFYISMFQISQLINHNTIYKTPILSRSYRDGAVVSMSDTLLVARSKLTSASFDCHRNSQSCSIDAGDNSIFIEPIGIEIHIGQFKNIINLLEEKLEALVVQVIPGELIEKFQNPNNLAQLVPKYDRNKCFIDGDDNYQKEVYEAVKRLETTDLHWFEDHQELLACYFLLLHLINGAELRFSELMNIPIHPNKDQTKGLIFASGCCFMVQSMPKSRQLRTQNHSSIMVDMNQKRSILINKVMKDVYIWKVYLYQKSLYMLNHLEFNSKDLLNKLQNLPIGATGAFSHNTNNQNQLRCLMMNLMEEKIIEFGTKVQHLTPPDQPQHLTYRIFRNMLVNISSYIQERFASDEALQQAVNGHSRYTENTNYLSETGVPKNISKFVLNNSLKICKKIKFCLLHFEIFNNIVNDRFQTNGIESPPPPPTPPPAPSPPTSPSPQPLSVPQPPSPTSPSPQPLSVPQPPSPTPPPAPSPVSSNIFSTRAMSSSDSSDYSQVKMESSSQTVDDSSQEDDIFEIDENEFNNSFKRQRR